MEVWRGEMEVLMLRNEIDSSSPSSRLPWFLIKILREFSFQFVSLMPHFNHPRKQTLNKIPGEDLQLLRSSQCSPVTCLPLNWKFCSHHSLVNTATVNAYHLHSRCVLSEKLFILEKWLVISTNCFVYCTSLAGVMDGTKLLLHLA